MVDADAVAGEKWRLLRYADTRRRAVVVGALVDVRVDRDTWNRVCDARVQAFEDLAWCDRAWLDLSVAHLDMVAENGTPGFVRKIRDKWGISIREGCRLLGPGSDVVTRLRESRSEAARRAHTQRGARRVRRAIDKWGETRKKTGRESDQSIKATLWLAFLYGETLWADALASLLGRMIVELAGDPRRPEAARRAAMLCADVGEVEQGRELYSIWHAAEMDRLADQHDDQARCEILVLRLGLAEWQLLNGEAARAETELRALLESFPYQLGTVKSRYDAAVMKTSYDWCHIRLADCLIAQDRWSEAHDAYVVAYGHIPEGGLMAFRATETELFSPTETELLNSVIYTGRQWRSDG